MPKKQPNEKRDVDATKRRNKLRDEGNPETQKLFDELEERISKIGNNIDERFLGGHVSFHAENHKTKNFVNVIIRKKQLNVHLLPLAYVDPKKKIEKIPERCRRTVNRRIYLNSQEDIDYAFPFIEQSYQACGK